MAPLRCPPHPAPQGVAPGQLRPRIGQRALLADPGFVPSTGSGTRSQAACPWPRRGSRRRRPRRSFFESLLHGLIAARMAGPHRHVAEAARVQQVAHRALPITTPKRRSIAPFGSTRRQRTTPSTATSGPASARRSNAVSGSALNSRGGPEVPGRADPHTVRVVPIRQRNCSLRLDAVHRRRTEHLEQTAIR